MDESEKNRATLRAINYIKQAHKNILDENYGSALSNIIRAYEIIEHTTYPQIINPEEKSKYLTIIEQTYERVVNLYIQQLEEKVDNYTTLSKSEQIKIKANIKSLAQTTQNYKHIRSLPEIDEKISEILKKTYLGMLEDMWQRS